MNPGDDISTDYRSDDASPYSPPERPVIPVLKPAAPRVWTVFVAVVLALVVATVAQTIVIVPIVIWLLATKAADPATVAGELQAMLGTPALFMLLAALAQISIGAAAILPARLSRVPAPLRLGLVKAALPSWGYPVVVLSALVPVAVGIGLAQLLAFVIPPDPSVQRLYEQMTPGMAVPFILFIALAPGVTEELLFRGYMQRRLLERWSPALAITVTSLLFAAVHVMPHAVVFALPIGVWLGVLAWRTGSVWPCMLCHAFINGSWNILNIGAVLFGWSRSSQWIGVGASLAVALACFGVSIWLIMPQRTEAAAARAEA